MSPLTAGRPQQTEINPLVACADALDRLHDATGSPVTARRVWQQTWLACNPSWRVALATVDDGDPAELVGAAALAVRRRRGITRVVALGAETADDVRLPALSASAVDRVADGVVHLLSQLPKPWSLDLTQLPVGDPVARRLADRLRGARLEPGDGSPRVVLGGGRTLKEHATTNLLRVYRKGLNRLAREERAVAWGHTRDAEEIAGLLPEIEPVRRARDHDAGRVSNLDDPGWLAFWRQVIVDHARRGEVDLTTMRIDGRLAAYVLAFVDGSALRFWDGRYHPDFAFYTPGRVIDVTVLERCLGDPAVTEVDWMRGEEPYKRQTANDVVAHERLRAWSHPAVAAVDTLPARLRDQARASAAEHPAIERAYRKVKEATLLRRARGGAAAKRSEPSEKAADDG